MQKVVVVTGASTGIGFDTVRALTEAGFLVVGTVRKDEDAENLKKTFQQKVKAIKIDLADLNAIGKLPEVLKNELNIHELHGLVNNAGVALAAPFLHESFEEVQQMFQVNVLALMKVTQQLIPMMKKDSRIINISSIAGLSASPFLAVYASTKHAVEGFSEALRKELMLLGIHVIVIGPGSIKTPIWQKGFSTIKDKYANTSYAEAFQKFISIALSQEKKGLEVYEVSNIVLKAMTTKSPCFRYAPVPNKITNWYIPKLLPKKVFNNMTAKVLGLRG